MTISIVQSAFDDAPNGQDISVVLGAAPTAGNVLIAMCSQGGANCTFSFSQGSWTEIASGIGRPGSDSYPMRYYRCVAGAGMSATTTISKSAGGSTTKGCIVELASAGPVVYQAGSSVLVQNTTGESCTGSVTPTNLRNALLLSLAMNGWTQSLTPASGMTTLGESAGADNLPVEWNYKLVQPANGSSHTIGSTGNDTTSSMLGIVLLEPLPVGGTRGMIL
jgi:hypothetical protein